LQKVSGSTGRSLTSEGQGETRRCNELVVNSELTGARSKPMLMKESNERDEELSESKRPIL